jgi:hypothetical protein
MAVGPAALPGRCGQHAGDRVPQALMAAGGDQGHAGQAAGGQAAQERQPAGAVLSGGHPVPRISRLPSALTPVAARACTFTVRPPSRAFWVSAPVLGCGGTSLPLDNYGVDAADGLTQAKVITRANHPQPTSTPGVYAKALADAMEDATWSARRDTDTGYGIAVFDVDPGDPGGQTSIKVTHYHALGADPVNAATGAPGAPTPDYTEFETFTLVRPRSDGRDRSDRSLEQSPVTA